MRAGWRAVVVAAIGLGVFVALGVSGSAAAATLTVTPDKASYAVGETITLTVDGDDQGASAFSIFGRLRYNAALTQTTSASQTQLQGATGPWTPGTLSTGDGFADAFNQIKFPEEDTAVNLPGVLSTVKLVAEAPGHVTVAWDTSPEFGLDFFGLTSAPGAELDIVAAPPPPDTPTCPATPPKGIVSGLIYSLGKTLASKPLQQLACSLQPL